MLPTYHSNSSLQIIELLTNPFLCQILLQNILGKSALLNYLVAQRSCTFVSYMQLIQANLMDYKLMAVLLEIVIFY